ncbi:MAG: hypothetical protein V3S98_08755 [Dehalococcoidia bacterium]
MHSETLPTEQYALGTIPTEAEVTRDVLGRFQEVNSPYWKWLTLLGILTLLGFVGFLIKANSGFGDDQRSEWGYMVATLGFLLSSFMAMPIISAGLRLTKANWRRPFTRIAENMAITGIIVVLMLIPALKALPPLEGRLNIWFNFPLGAPFQWDVMAFSTLAFIGLVLLWTVGLPDLAAARDHLPPSRRRSFISRLSLGWTGNVRQWRVHRMSVLTMGAMYLLFYPLVMTLMSTDFSAGLLPGVKDAIAPATAVAGAVQAGLGMMMITMYLMRRLGGYDRYFTVEQFWALAKPMLALSLLWFYFWWASFITFWYGRQPAESELLRFLMLDQYRTPLMISFFLNFLGPLIALVWNPVRRSIWGPVLVGTGIVFGAFINHIRLYVSAFSIEDPGQHVLSSAPATQWPDAPDILIIVGAVSACVLLFMLVSKIIPVISIWEINEGLRLVKVRKFLGTTVRVIAKSH